MEVPGSDYKTKTGGKSNLEALRGKLDNRTEDLRWMRAAFNATKREQTWLTKASRDHDKQCEITGMEGPHGYVRHHGGQKGRDQGNASSVDKQQN